RRRHTRSNRDWSADVCSADLPDDGRLAYAHTQVRQQSFGLVPIDDHVYTAFTGRGDLPGVELHHQVPLGVETHGVVQRSDRMDGDRKSVVEGKGGNAGTRRVA